MTCPYCGSKAVLVSSAVVYGGRDFGRIWCCPRWPQCDSYVGCHRGTKRPLGSLANAELRAWRRRAHAVFDRLWRTGGRRNDWYGWLASELGIAQAQCHIGMFDVEQCKRVVELCGLNQEAEA